MVYCSFFEYVDPTNTDAALNGLNGLKIGERTLTIRRAISRDQQSSAIDHTQLSAAQLGELAVQQAQLHSAMKPSTSILVLTNMFDIAELNNPDDYNDIKNDVIEECNKYNTLIHTILPRPGEVGAGKIYLQYNSPESAAKIRSEVEGRQFGSHVVLADYLDEQAFYNGQLA